MKLFTTLGLIIGLSAALLLAFSIEVKDAFPLEESAVQFNVLEVNDQIVDRSEASYVTVKPSFFYPGIILLFLAFLLQLVGLYKDK